MSVYRITRFAAADMSGLATFSESIRNEIESLDADSIDIVSYGNGKGVVLAKYPNQAAMDSKAEAAKSIFGKMVEAKLIDGESIHPHMGEVIKSF
ncbi:MAG: hypothetical protein ACI9W2_002884 [Gammaproteobacteria bacterium]|jgi:hypothetical protein